MAKETSKHIISPKFNYLDNIPIETLETEHIEIDNDIQDGYQVLLSKLGNEDQVESYLANKKKAMKKKLFDPTDKELVTNSESTKIRILNRLRFLRAIF